MDQQTVGVRELMARPRRYLRHVKSGKTILTTLGNASRGQGLDVWPQDLG